MDEKKEVTPIYEKPAILEVSALSMLFQGDGTPTQFDNLSPSNCTPGTDLPDDQFIC